MQLRLVWSLVAALVIGVDVSPVHAASDQAQIVRQKINLSGRQRMLSQRISSTSCLAMTGFNDAVFDPEAQRAHDEFEQALAGLRNGNDALGITAETDENVITNLDAVEAEWRAMSPSVQQLASGYRGSRPLLQIMARNDQVLHRSDALVQSIVAKYGTTGAPDGLAEAIDLAGRQRMLSQRMIKSACFIYVNVGREAAIADLALSIEHFDLALKLLRHGDTGRDIASPPSKAVSDQLEVVASLWVDYRKRLEGLASGARRSSADLLAIATAGEEILEQSHQVVLRYVD